MTPSQTIRLGRAGSNPLSRSFSRSVSCSKSQGTHTIGLGDCTGRSRSMTARLSA
ncbi:Uncharacterised protein [Mycobacteroides abscessus subsp. abscessus]|nr:Uncharacterised protein [Mycobacteroides abscessus subsp. abscessus]